MSQRSFSGGAYKRFDDLVRGRKPDFHKRVRILDFLAGINGGGALPSAVDQFFGAAGILLLEGYGLTETGLVVAVRKQWRPVPGTVGNLVNDTDCEIRDEHGTVLPPGEQGIVFLRGPQVMKGYYERPDLTSQVLSDDGWLNTGDIGMLTHSGELKITGRAKDTIVLRGGENIEPLPIEQKLRESQLIDQAAVVGHDQKFLGALVVPNEEGLRAEIEAQSGPAPGTDKQAQNLAELIALPEAVRVVEQQIAELVSARNGFRGFEQICRFRLIADEFEIGKELSAKQEVKRHVINEKYGDTIAEIFS